MARNLLHGEGLGKGEEGDDEGEDLSEVGHRDSDEGVELPDEDKDIFHADIAGDDQTEEWHPRVRPLEQQINEEKKNEHKKNY